MRMIVNVSDCDANIFYLRSKVRRKLTDAGRGDDAKALEKAIEKIEKTKGIDHRSAIVEAVKAVVQLEGWE